MRNRLATLEVVKVGVGGREAVAAQGNGVDLGAGHIERGGEDLLNAVGPGVDRAACQVDTDLDMVPSSSDRAGDQGLIVAPGPVRNVVVAAPIDSGNLLPVAVDLDDRLVGVALAVRLMSKLTL